jgi:hypothetical protein
MKTKQYAFLTCLVLIVVSCAALAQQAPAVNVKSFQTNLPDGTIRYQYRVINSGPTAIVGFAIGSDYYHGVSQLTTVPKGWDFDNGLPAGSSASPTNWQASVITTEESPFTELEWRNSGTADIQPGQTLSGFAVITPQPDNAYLNGLWTVFFSDSTIASAALVVDDNPAPVDNTPPSITVALTPSSIWPPDGTMYAVTATVSVHDDQTLNPAVKLVSITCSEPLEPGDVAATFGVDSRTFSVRSTRLGQDKTGRIYTVTYSATDAAGNTSTATATVTVPHDQRN